ncbi:L-2-hydroxyglutarate oxidase [Cellulomonas soli]
MGSFRRRWSASRDACRRAATGTCSTSAPVPLGTGVWAKSTSEGRQRPGAPGAGGRVGTAVRVHRCVRGPFRRRQLVARVVVVGAGIVGLAVAARLADGGHEVTVLEKEPAVARHQTGRNSGVIHSGLYYAPGSLKARMATAGAASMKEYAQRRGVPVRTCGKLVVASDDSQVPGLHRLAERAVANDVDAQLLTPAQAREHEPHIASVAALWVTQTGVVDYPGVCAALVEDVVERGGQLLTDTQVVAAHERADGLHVQVRTGQREHELTADLLVACAGLQADRVARACGIEPAARIVPFRGEYATVREPAASLVRGLVYPVPDPRFPFLGVHLTRGVDGHVHAGPNAVLALAREGYTWGQVSPRDVLDTFSLARPVAHGRAPPRVGRRRGGPLGVPPAVRAVGRTVPARAARRGP